MKTGRSRYFSNGTVPKTFYMFQSKFCLFRRHIAGRRLLYVDRPSGVREGRLAADIGRLRREGKDRVVAGARGGMHHVDRILPVGQSDADALFVAEMTVFDAV